VKRTAKEQDNSLASVSGKPNGFYCSAPERRFGSEMDEMDIRRVFGKLSRRRGFCWRCRGGRAAVQGGVREAAAIAVVSAL
jgi:hypothetical protein